METLLGQEKCPDVSTEQRRAGELVKLIRKLRWMGLEGETEHVQMAQRRGPLGTVLLTSQVSRPPSPPPAK